MILIPCSECKPSKNREKLQMINQELGQESKGNLKKKKIPKAKNDLKRQDTIKHSYNLPS